MSDKGAASPSSASRPRIWLLTVGDELLSGDTVDTNSAFLGDRCRALGLEVVRALTVRDREEEIAEAIRATSNCEICLICGGLGPTLDDLTAAGVARGVGVALELDGPARARLEEKYRQRGRAMPAANVRQAHFPRGARPLANPIGTAEGFELRAPWGARIFVMPGVPRELEAMMRDEVEPRLRDAFDLEPVRRRTYRILGLGESTLAERIEPVLQDARGRSPGLAAAFVHYRADDPEVLLTVEALADARGVAASAEELESLDEPLRDRLGSALYGIGEAPLAVLLIDALERRGMTFGTAESCTGGGVARRVAAIAGASSVFVGGIVAYANEIKQEVLGVPGSLLAEHGAVSEPVARAMAEGARRVLGCDLCVSITGIAGPSGGTPLKPVGTVHFAVSDSAGTEHRRLQLRGNRGTVQRSAELWALELAWDRLRRASGART